MNVCVMLAGGTGSRLGADIPKQFIEVVGKPMIAHTLDAFEQHDEIDAVEVVCKEDYIPDLWEIVERYGYSKVRWVVPGGATFQDSVICGIDGLEGKCAEEDIVLVHYADCPLVTADIITDAIAVAKEHRCASPAMSEIDLTCAKTHDDHSTAMTNRDEVICLQAPLTMQFGFAKWVYEEGRRTGALYEVEPHTQTLITTLGEEIWFSKNNRLNFKVTTKEDLEIFEAIVMHNSMRNG